MHELQGNRAFKMPAQRGKREREVENGEWIERKRKRERKGKVENGELER